MTFEAQVRSRLFKKVFIIVRFGFEPQGQYVYALSYRNETVETGSLTMVWPIGM